MYSSLSLRRNKNLFPSFPLCMGYPLLSDVDRDPEWGDLGLQHRFPKQLLLQHRELLCGLQPLPAWLSLHLGSIDCGPGRDSIPGQKSIHWAPC